RSAPRLKPDHAGAQIHGKIIASKEHSAILSDNSCSISATQHSSRLRNAKPASACDHVTPYTLRARPLPFNRAALSSAPQPNIQHSDSHRREDLPVLITGIGVDTAAGV